MIVQYKDLCIFFNIICVYVGLELTENMIKSCKSTATYRLIKKSDPRIRILEFCRNLSIKKIALVNQGAKKSDILILSIKLQGIFKMVKGFIVGLIVANGFEWVAHKYILHGTHRAGQPRFSPVPRSMKSHWEHHREVRKQEFHDDG